MDQETLMRASFMERQAQEIEQHLQFIEAQLTELENIKSAIRNLNSSKQKSTISTLANGIYLKTSLEDKNLLVDVGSGVVIKKSPEETIKIIENQIEKLQQAHLQLSAQRESFHNQLQSLIEKIEKEKNN